MNKVVVWIDLDTRFEQAENLGKSEGLEKKPRNGDSQVTLW